MQMRLESLIKQLPPELQKEVEDFVQFLVQKRGIKPRRKLKMNWAGGLKHLRKNYTSVELQHKISEWRI